MDQSPLDALAERIARIGRGESETALNTMRQEHSTDPARLSTLVEKAIIAMDDTLRRNEDKTASALESVAKWMERNDTARIQPQPQPRMNTEFQSQQDAALTRTMSLLVSRLDELDSKISNQQNPATNDMRHMLEKIETRLESIGKMDNRGSNSQDVTRSLGDLEHKLSDLSRRLEPSYAEADAYTQSADSHNRRPAPRQRSSREPVDVEQMMAGIAARQRDLDENSTRSRLQDLGARLDRHKSEELSRADRPQRSRDDLTLSSLRNDLQGITSILNGFAPREQFNAIETAIHNLATKIELTRENVTGEKQANTEKQESAQLAVANVERQLNTVLSKLDVAGQNNDVLSLTRDIENMQHKLDKMSEASVDSNLLKQLHGNITDIHDKLAHASAKPASIEAIETKLAALSEQLEKGSAQGSNADAKLLSDLSARIERIQHSIDVQSAPSTDLSQIELMIQKLNQKVDSLSQRPAETNTLELAIRALEDKLDKLPVKSKNQISSTSTPQIEDILKTISAKLDSNEAASAPSENDVSRIVRALEEKIEHVQLNSPAHREFENLIRSVEDKITSLQSYSADNNHFGTMVTDLAKQMEKAQKPGASDHALEALQTQVSRLTAKLEKTDDHFASLGSLERTIGDIFSQLDSVKFASRDAAEVAARNAVRDALVELNPNEKRDNHEVKQLVTHVASIRLTQDETDRRTQGTLEAVHETLEKIVDRLGMLESELVAGNGKINISAPYAPQAKSLTISDFEQAASTPTHKVPLNPESDAFPPAIAPASPEQYIPYKAPSFVDYEADESAADAPAMFAKPKPDFQQAVAASSQVPAQSKVTREFSADLDPDAPLEPGTQRPVIGLNAASNQLTERTSTADPIEMDPARRIQNAKASFIAAARKAAQAAADQSAAALNEAKEGSSKSGLLADAKQAVGSRAKALVGYRKPILLGFAAIVLATGGAAVYKTRTPTLKTTNNTLKQIKELPVTAEKSSEPDMIADAKGFSEKESKLSAEMPVATTRMPANEAQTLAREVPVREVSAREISARELPVKVEPPIVPAVKVKPPRLSDLGASPASTIPAARENIVQAAVDPIPVGAIPQKNLPSLAQPMLPASQNLSRGQSPARGQTNPNIAAFDDVKSQAEAGDARAQYDLGSRYIDGVSVQRDPKLATQWLEKAAAQGLAPAQYRLGSLYRDGKGLRNDSKLAFEWFKRAAEQGNARAMHNLAVVLAEGANGAPDYAGASEWFRKGAELGIKDSQFNVAILYARGLGVSQDLVQSYKWFAVAATFGDEDASRKRDEVGTKLTPEKLAEAKAAAQNYKAKTLDAMANDVQPVVPSKNSVTASPVGKGNS